MAKIINGGKKFTLDGIEINVLKAYSPKWENISNGLNAGEEIKFSLSFTVYGLTEREMINLKDSLSKAVIPLSCDEFEGNVRCTDISPALVCCNFYGTYYEISAEVTECGNDGIGLTVGNTEIHNLSSYSPKWTLESEGLESKQKFSVDFTTYKLTSEEMTALKNELSENPVAISCPGFSGSLKCTNIATDYKNDNYYGSYYILSASLVQTDGEEEQGAGDKTITVNGYSITKFGSYNPSWSYGEDSAQQKYGRKFSLNVTTHNSSSEELSAIIAAIGTAEEENKDIRVELVCDEFSGDAYCASVSPSLKDNGLYDISLNFTEVTRQPETVSVTVGDVTVNSFGSYNPKWAQEALDSGSSFTSWNGEIVSTAFGIRFSLDFTASGMTHENAMALKAALCAADLELRCAEFSGNVICENIAMTRKISEYYGEFYDVTASLKAAVLDTQYGGSL